MKFFVVLVVAIALAVPALSVQSDQAEGTSAAPGHNSKALPPINLQDFDGKAVPRISSRATSWCSTFGRHGACPV
jgi:hypothetical protein